MKSQLKILKAMKATQKGFEEKYHQKFFNSYGFANSYSLIVTKETAKNTI